MIRLTCTSCKQLLTIDDAFADGVCRCQFCGTIQTVPSKLKGASKSAAGAGKSAKSLYRNPAAKSAAAPTGTTLDNLAEIVSSSGLAGSGLSSMASRKKPVPAKAPESPKKMTPILIIGGAIILLLLAIVAILLLKGGAGTPGANPAPNPTAGASGATGGAETPGAGNPTGLESGSPGAGAPPPTAAQAGANPNFCGIPLTGQTIIYVLDNGSGSKDVFGDLLDATLRSAASLGPDRRFRIIFWDKSSSPSFPTTGFSPGDADSIESARSALANVVAYGATDPIAALTDALKLRPDRIVLATAKSADLGDDTAARALSAADGTPTRIETIAIGGSGASAALRTIAAKTGGEYKELSSADLSAPLK